MYPISAVTGQGVESFFSHVKELLDSCEREPILFEQEFFPEDVLITENIPFTVQHVDEHIFCCGGTQNRKNAWLYKIWIPRRDLHFAKSG